MPNDKFEMILEKKDNNILRKFPDSMKTTESFQALPGLLRNGHFKDALGEEYKDSIEHISKAKDRDNFFFQFQQVPWYLDLLAKELIDNKTWKCSIVLKNCAGHLFIDSHCEENRKFLLPPFFHKAVPTTRGFCDTCLFLSTESKDKKNKEQFDDLFHWSEIELITSPVKELKKNSCYKLTFKLKVNCTGEETDENKECIKIYSESKKEPNPILVASPNFRKAIEDLSEVWHNPAAKSVLLLACPGSGKEKLKEILVYALRVKKNSVIDLAAPVVSSEDPVEQIFKRLSSKNLFKKDKIKTENKPVVLFFDEIHHQSAKLLREKLLRFMEEPQIQNRNKNFDLEGLLYIFAASQQPDDLRNMPPSDFWTRIEYTVTMSHPLLLGSDEGGKEARNHTLRQYFNLFWRMAAKNREKYLVDGNGEKNIIKLLMEEQCLKKLSEAFANELDSPLIPIISIRMIRSMINRLFSKTIYCIRTENINIDPIDIYEGIKPKLDQWIINIFKEQISEINPKEIF